MISQEATTALVFFGLSSLIFGTVEYFNNFVNSYVVQLVLYALLVLLLRLVCQKRTFDIAIQSVFLGCTSSIGALIILTASESWTIFGIYIIVLSMFHYTEFLAIALTNPQAASADSFVLNHSKAYAIAAASSWLEFLTERYYFPDYKLMSIVSTLGLCACIGGEILRKSAIFTAKRNFNHIVQNERVEDHRLVTSGVYAICRHPSYVGWFYWSIGTQILLQNPVCFFAYLLASWKFFEERIFYEELNLLRFFGNAYQNYQKKVGTGLPFIAGYKLEDEEVDEKNA